MFVHGQVEIIAEDGKSRSAERGAPVYSGESIRSGKSSSLQLKMVDDGYLAIRPSTEVRIDEYRFKGDTADRAQTSLLRGGLRSITGSIGKKRKESFKLRTPVATIGVRGTDFEIFYQPGDQTDLPQGAYLRVNAGRGYLQNYAGVQFVNPNQTGFVATRSSQPVLLKDAPRIFNLPTTDIFSGDKAQQGSGQNDKNTRGDDEELVDLDLPPDLQDSWQQDDSNPVITDNSLPDLDIDLGVLGDATAPDVIDSQSGSFRYSSSNLTLSGFSAESASASLDINFNTNTVGYQLDITGATATAGTASTGPTPAAIASGSNWNYNGTGSLNDFTTARGMAISGSYNGVSGASGYWYGIFTGDNADGLFTGFTLCSTGYSGSVCNGEALSGTSETGRRDPITEPEPEIQYPVALSGDYHLRILPVSSSGGSGYEIKSSYSSNPELKVLEDGRLFSVKQSYSSDNYEETFSALSQDKVSGALKSSGGDTLYWGYWDGYKTVYSGQETVLADQKFYYTCLNSGPDFDINDTAINNSVARFNLAGGFAHGSDGSAYGVKDGSHLLIDFGQNKMGGRFLFETTPVEGAYNQWDLTVSDDISGVTAGIGTAGLSGSYNTYGSGDLLSSDTATGSWGYLWGGSNGQFISGEFNANANLSSGGSADLNGVIGFEGGVPTGSAASTGWGGLLSAVRSDTRVSGYNSSFDPVADTSVGIYLDSENRLTGLYNSTNTLTVTGGSFVAGADSQGAVLSSKALSDSTTKVSWGRWDTSSAGEILLGENADGQHSFSELKQLHYIAANNLTTQNEFDIMRELSGQGQTSFSLTGGTVPSLVNDSGTVNGKLNYLDLSISFYTGAITADMAISFENDTQLTANNFDSPTTISSPGFSIGMDGTLTGPNQSSVTVNGSLMGQFIGDSAQGAIVSYDLKSDSGSQINGAALLEQNQSQQTSPGL